ncbi:MAG: hypothetical protein NTW19_20750 [Planctomycetota bacterium]|nr:hypothetical protein [Planctomycetota bacterium]
MDSSGPQQLLAELAKLESLRNPQSEQKLRAYRRFVLRGDAELSDMERGPSNSGPIQVLLRDIGRGGVGFICPQPLELNSTWRIAFLHRGYAVGHQGIVIRHCREVQAGVYLIGTQFCIETGMMCLLGIDPAAIRDGDKPAKSNEPALYLAPGEVA